MRAMRSNCRLSGPSNLGFLLLLTLLSLTAPAVNSQSRFQLLSAKETNIKFKNAISETEGLNVLSYEYFYNGGGVATGDLNNDGLEDLFFTGNMSPNKLYVNKGNLKFSDITKKAGAGLEGRKGGWRTGVTMADVNGDGLLDIYICYSGKNGEALRRNELFINKGNLTFEEKAREYGLDDAGYGTQAAFFDFDNDGDLDMFLLNHSVKKFDQLEISQFREEVDELVGNKLFRNDGSTFVDISKEAGLNQSPLIFGLGVAVADIDGDGFQDIYVTNDYSEPDYLYLNTGKGQFIEQAQVKFKHLPQFSMGVDVADINNDGHPDILNLDMLPADNRRQKLLQLQENYESFALMEQQGLYRQYMRNMLQLNNGDGTFSEIGQLAGLASTDWSWCPLLADFDNDGFKDVFITNGYLRDYTNKDFLRYWGDYKIKRAMEREPYLLMDLIKAMPSTLLPNYIFKNNQDLTFANKQREWGFSTPSISSAAVYADLDNDGDLELVVNNINAEAFVYKNLSRESDQANYVSFQLKEESGNTHAVGAKLYVYAGGKLQYSQVNPNKGYLSCVSTVANFGLGEQGKIDSVRIVWPDNTAQLLRQVAVNQRHVVQKGAETALPHANKTQEAVARPPLFQKVEPLIAHKPTASAENDFKRQPLMLFMYSKTSPVVAKGDVNRDGLEDLFVSGDKSTGDKLYLQKPDGSFTEATLSRNSAVSSTTSAAVFFDANGDGHLDLYLAKGGYALYEPNTPALQDELHLNDGKGNFTLSAGALPDMSAASKSCVRFCDYDNDGDLDLFVGANVVPGRYPESPTSYLLNNNGKGKFTSVQIPFSQAGMVTDAQWADLNNDGRQDLILCGEFMPITVFTNEPGGFVNATASYFDHEAKGFWKTISLADLNGDGKLDIIAGNLGLNSPIQVSEKEPAEMVFADFDNNGSVDPFFSFYMQGKSYPFISRDELNEQMYGMRKKFTSYQAYADAAVQDILSAEEMEKAQRLSVNENRTVIFLQTNGRFIKKDLPTEAQFSVVNQVLTGDFNSDGKKDVLLFGNHSYNRLKIGSIDASYGCLLAGDGKGNFTYVTQPQSGLSVAGDVKSAIEIKVGKQNYLLLGADSEPLQFYRKP